MSYVISDACISFEASSDNDGLHFGSSNFVETVNFQQQKWKSLGASFYYGDGADAYTISFLQKSNVSKNA
jgi:hypothetical protein